MIRVYADMVADLFHYGHVEFLRQVSSLGDYVLVGINANDVVEVHKRRPVQTMEERIAAVGACRYVDEVVPNAPWVFDPTWIAKYDIDLVVHGDDYSDRQRRYFYQVPIAHPLTHILSHLRWSTKPGQDLTADARHENPNDGFQSDVKPLH